ncbi:OLC1v1025902C1 [Oldenlandia corymbosa var. corymbosa]|uniref:OLC1v1025902C1 n=1 Tax=Oldenlandia corymbosa var. corymbosa TaxID=529605 RepID=A0AAV1C974_OLDCO|nr:OLC1v1025902C1 [Oldenlandia corymbosa var. corymbosa]
MEFGSHKESGHLNFLKETNSVSPIQSAAAEQILRKRKQAEMILHHPKQEPSCRGEYEDEITRRAHKQQFIDVDELWKGHIHMEELLGNFETVGIIFELWLKQQPSQQGWLSYIEFELKYNGAKSARGIFERFVEWLPENCSSWIKYAAMERSSGESERARMIFQRAFDLPALDRPDLLWKAYVDFAKFSSIGEVAADVDQLLKKLKSKKQWRRLSSPWMMDSTKNKKKNERVKKQTSPQMRLGRCSGKFVQKMKIFLDINEICHFDYFLLLSV